MASTTKQAWQERAFEHERSMRHEEEVRAVLDAEDLDAATELAVREQLDALADPDLDDETAERRWRRVRELAPGLGAIGSARRNDDRDERGGKRALGL